MLATTNAALENALVDQKNAVVVEINACEDGDDLAKVVDLFAMLSPVWSAAEYGYKATEIRNRIRSKALAMLSSEEDYLSTLRKNDRTRRGTEANIAKLNAIVAAH